MTEDSSFERWVLEHQDMVYATAYRLLGREADAEDVAQQAFMRSWQHWSEVSQSKTPAAWLRTVTRNLCLNQLTRYRSRWRFFSEWTSAGDDGEERELPFAVDDTAQREALNPDQKEILEAAVAQLPHDLRIALVLYHFEDLDYDEIARQLKVSLGKVKTDIHRARLALKKKLQLRMADLGV